MAACSPAAAFSSHWRLDSRRAAVHSRVAQRGSFRPFFLWSEKHHRRQRVRPVIVARAAAAAAGDYYGTLGLDRSATKQEIKSSYRKLALEFHPDVNKSPDAGERFREISSAYEVLSDDDKRRLYDQYGVDGDGSSSSQPFSSDTDNPFDIFNTMFNDFGGRSADWVVQGDDLSHEISLDLKDALVGVEREFQIWRLKSCDSCKGTGAKSKRRKKCRVCSGYGEVSKTHRAGYNVFSEINTCPNCNGEGEVVLDPCKKCGGKATIHTKEDIKLNIPCGVDNGSTLRVESAGDACKGGPAGDLFINLKIKSPPGIRREGVQLHSDVSISYTSCILGSTVKVKTLEGSADLRVPAGTQPGDTLVLKKCGMPKLNKPGQRGNHNFCVKVKLPKHISEAEKSLVEELARLESSEPVASATC